MRLRLLAAALALAAVTASCSSEHGALGPEGPAAEPPNFLYSAEHYCDPPNDPQCIIYNLLNEHRFGIQYAIYDMDPVCFDLAAAAQSMLDSNDFYYYTNWNGESGDAHIGGAVHIYEGTFDSTEELKDTVIHEVAHVFYNADEAYANSLELECS